MSELIESPIEHAELFILGKLLKASLEDEEHPLPPLSSLPDIHPDLLSLLTLRFVKDYCSSQQLGTINQEKATIFPSILLGNIKAPSFYEDAEKAGRQAAKNIKVVFTIFCSERPFPEEELFKDNDTFEKALLQAKNCFIMRVESHATFYPRSLTLTNQPPVIISGGASLEPDTGTPGGELFAALYAGAHGIDAQDAGANPQSSSQKTGGKFALALLVAAGIVEALLAPAHPRKAARPARPDFSPASRIITNYTGHNPVSQIPEIESLFPPKFKKGNASRALRPAPSN